MWHLPHVSSIGAKIFAAFVVMSLITGAIGGYGLYVLSAAGEIVVDTYDRPLMAINFARSASLTFSRMERVLLERRMAAAPARPAIDRDLERLTAVFFEDLRVASDRSLSDEERGLAREIEKLVRQWSEVRIRGDSETEGKDLDALAKRIAERFDLLIEMTTGHSFVERRKAIWAISRFEYTSVAAIALALLLSFAITLLLARRIIRPLTGAAAVADRIARGELQTPIPSGGRDETGILLRSMTVMQDNIRAMIEREAALRRRAQSRLVDALESSREAMVLVDAAGKVVLANSQVAQFFPSAAAQLVEGADFADAVSKIEREIAALVPVGAEGRTEASNPAGAVSLSAGGEFRLPDARWVRISRSSTQDGGYFLFVSDFTGIKEREQRYKEAKVQAEAASAAKSKFLANMSHELRTPLNSIIGFSEIIAGELHGKLERREYVEHANYILESGRHLLDVINSVLDLTKKEVGKLQVRPEEVVLTEILEFCAKMIARQCAAAGLEFRKEWPERPLTLQGEPAKLRQILINLLSNAVKFSEPGGRVTLSMRQLNDDLVEVSVTDTGIGMRLEDVPLALSPFGQIDTRLSRRHEGTGLGLPLTKAFVEMHGGTMTIDTELGRGTRVSVILSRSLQGARESSSLGFLRAS
jgi:signal transduction histidine kinase